MSIRVLGAAVLLCLVSTVASAQQYTVRDFVSDPKASIPYLSPNGKHIAMRVPDGATTRLVVYDLDTRKFTLSIGFGGNIHVGSFDWVSGDRLVFDTIIKVGFLDQKLLTGNRYGIDYDGKGKALLWGPEAGDGTFTRVIDDLRDDDDNIIVLSYGGGSYTNQAAPIAWKIDVNQDLGKGDSGSRVNRPKRTKLVTSPADNGWMITDPEGKAWAALGTNEKTGEPQAFYRAPGETEWRDISAVVKADENADFDSFTKDGRIVLVTDKDDGFDGVFLFDPRTNERTMVAGRSDVDVARLLRSFDGTGRAIGVDYLPGYPERQYVATKDPDAIMFAKVEAHFPDDIVEITSVDLARTKALVYTWNDRNAGDAYLYDIAQDKLQRLFNVRPNLDRALLAESFPVAYPARDGKTIHGYLTLPPGGKKGLPLVVLPHGGPHGIWDRWGWDEDGSYYPEVQLLAHHGYAVFQPNFRGSGGYGAPFEVSGYMNWATTMQDDLTDGVKWAIAKGYADPKRVCIYGASYGGYAALMSPAREPDLYKCAIGYVGVYDVSVLFDRSDTKRTASGRRWLERFHGTDPKFWAGESPVNFVDRIKADLMLVAGEEDERVNIEHYRRMAAALTKAGHKFDSLVKPNEGHGFAEVENRVELYTKMLAFLQRNIGGADTRVAAPDNPPAK
jgi:dipeptidyl aminopeptidase/acylaminoacyl peptidase